MGPEKRKIMYTSYFGFREEPFNISPDPRFFYANPGHEEAYASILYGIRQRKGYISLIGEAGTGKTTLLRRIVGDLEKTIRVAFYYYNTTLTFDEFLDFICTSFGLQVQEGRKLEKIQAIDKFLRERLAEGGTGVVIIDEAHHLADEVLENLRLLSNIELDNHKLLQIVLVGQPELEQKLDRSELRQLKQRIAVSCRLGCLKPQAVEPFIHYRMQTAGCNRYDVFSPQAIRLIAARSDGIPRIINTICDNSLSVAYQTAQNTVSEQVVEKVTTDLRLIGKSASTPQAQHQGTEKAGVPIRLEDRLLGQGASSRSTSESPEIWIGERPQGWSRHLPWVGIGTVVALLLLYLGNTSLFPPVSVPPDKGVALVKAQSPATTAQSAAAPASIAPEKAPTQDLTVIASLAQEPVVAKPVDPAPSAPPEVKNIPSSEQPAATLSPATAPAVTAPTPANEPSPVLPENPPTTDSRGQAITVARGDTVSELILKVYGNYNALALDLIKEFNPNIVDLDRIIVGQRLVLPTLSRETLLRKQDDGKYRLILGTFAKEIEAEKAAQEVRGKGYVATVTKRRVTVGGRPLYRVELEKLPDTATVDRAWKLINGGKS